MHEDLRTVGLHERLVLSICEQDARCRIRGFVSALVDSCEEVREELSEFLHRLQFKRRPDAYRIDEENKYVYIYEVEITHGLSAAKMDDYSDLWFELDCFEWGLVLIHVDSEGYPTEVSLGDVWYQKNFHGEVEPLHVPVSAERVQQALTIVLPPGFMDEKDST